jgi:geranylgeranylglycerol-phosphate geranylgeranyltransferase
MKTVLATIEIVRPHNMIAAAGCILAAYWLSGGSDPSVVVWPAVFTALVTGLGNLINDYWDADIDRVNKPGRPIPSGRLSRRSVHRAYWFLTIAVAAGMLARLHGPLLFLILSWHVLLYYYARRGKRVAAVGNLLISAIAASAFVGGAALAGDFRRIPFAVFYAFLLVLGRELVKGAEDIDGDRQAGAGTLAVRLGPEKTALWSATVLLVFVASVPIPALIRTYARGYALVMLCLVVPGVLGVTWGVLHSTDRPMLRWASRILKVEMFFGIIAMALGRL